VNLIKDYNGESAGIKYTRDTRPLLESIPLGLRKMILLSKLSGAAKTAAYSLPDAATVEDVLTVLEQQFQEPETKIQEIFGLRQYPGQSIDDFAKVFNATLSKINSGGDAKVSNEIARSLFIEGVVSKTRNQLILLEAGKNLTELIALAKLIESTTKPHDEAHAMILERRIARLEERPLDTIEEKRHFKRKWVEPCGKCGKTNHAEEECLSHVKCYKCGKYGHMKKDCRGGRKRISMNLISVDSAQLDKKVSPPTTTPIAHIWQPQPQPNQHPTLPLIQPTYLSTSPYVPTTIHPQVPLAHQHPMQVPFPPPNPNPYHRPYPNQEGMISTGNNRIYHHPHPPAQPYQHSNASGSNFDVLLNTESSDIGLFAVMTLFDSRIPIPMVIDSGCTRSACSIELIQTLNITSSPLQDNINFRMANGNIQPCSSKARLLLSSFNRCQDFYVIPMAYPILLGTDFLVKNEVVLDFGNLTLKLGKKFHHLIPYSSSKTPSVLQLELKQEDVSNEVLPQIFPLNENKTLDEDWKTAQLGQWDDVKMVQLKELLQKFASNFANELPPNHCSKLPPYQLNLYDYSPIKVRPYRCSVTQMIEVKKHIDKLLACDAIEPCQSPWNSPVLLVSKKDNSTRCCIDFRRVNSVTIPDAAQLPKLEMHLYRLGKGRIFTTLDMTSGYHQITLAEASRDITAFCADGSGQSYRWKKLPFGLMNAPVAFMSRMSKILSFNYTLVYIDDIIIFSESFEEHLIHLTKVMEVLEKKRVVLKPKKCFVGMKEVEFLGHRIDGIGIYPTHSKVEALNNIAIPKSKTELKSFLGLIGFYRRFIPRFAQRTKALFHVLKETTFVWNDTCHREMMDVINFLREATLQHPNFDLEFLVHTDASEVAIGGALHQLNPATGEIHPLCFHSRLLSKAEQKYPIGELEALALVSFVERNVELLAAKHFKVFCDNSNLVHIFKSGSKLRQARVTRYAIRLSEFNFSIEHITSAQNGVADYLSRFARKEENSFAINILTRSQVRSNLHQRKENNDDNKINHNNINNDDNKIKSDNNNNNININSINNNNNIINNNSNSERRVNDRNDDPESKNQLEQNDQKVERQNPNAPLIEPNQETVPENFPTLREIQLLQKRDVSLQKLLENDRFIQEEGVLYFVGNYVPFNEVQKRVVIPKSLELWVLCLYHDTKLGGHCGIQKMLHRMQQDVWMRKMPSKVKRYVSSCFECQMRKSNKMQLPLVKPFSSQRPCQLLHIDLVGPLVMSHKENRYILVNRDSFTRFVKLEPIKSKHAPEVASALVKFFCLFGLPLAVLSDNGKEFRNRLDEELMKKIRN